MTHIASSSPEKYVPTCCTYIGCESFDEHLFRKENEAEILSFAKQTNLFCQFFPYNGGGARGEWGILDYVLFELNL